MLNLRIGEGGVSTSGRLLKCEVRDDHHAGPHGGNRIFEHKFCFDYRSLVCSDKSHDHRELHPALRVPKKNASRLHWKRFFDAYDRYGDSNRRQFRH